MQIKNLNLVLSLNVVAKPPSVNKYLKRTRSGFTYISKETKDFKNYVRNQLRISDPHHRTKAYNGSYLLRICICGKFIGKNGKPLVKDLDNFLKVPIDAIKDAAGLRDELIWEIQAKKINSNVDQVFYDIYEIV